MLDIALILAAVVYCSYGSLIAFFSYKEMLKKIDDGEITTVGQVALVSLRIGVGCVTWPAHMGRRKE